MPPVPNTERRRSDRYSPAYTTFCRTSTGNEGIVWNISATGLGMLVAFQPEPGLNVGVELLNHATSLFLVAKVAHVRQLEGGDSFVGLRFDRSLERHELAPFVRTLRGRHAGESSQI